MSEKTNVILSMNVYTENLARVLAKITEDHMSLETFLENVINDLGGGRGSHGSDECMLIDQWYDRCGYGWETL